MRAILALSLLVGVAACDTGRGIAPDASVIVVRLEEAGGVAVRPTQVILTQASGAEIVTRSGEDGLVAIAVDAPGVHRVRVIPRDGYAAPEGTLRRDVTVAPGARTVASFTLYPVGRSGEPGEPYYPYQR